MLETLIALGYGQDRNLLLKLSQELDCLKIFIRLGKDTRAITPQQYILIQSQLQEIGKMIGGWLKVTSR